MYTLPRMETFLTVTCEDCGYIAHDVYWITGFPDWECPRCGALMDLGEWVTTDTGIEDFEDERE